MRIKNSNLPIINPKSVLTSVFTKFSDGNMIDKESTIVFIKICFSFDLTNSSLKISELESNNGPVF